MFSTHVWSPFSHVLCPVYIFYVLYTYFMSIRCILWCPIHIFYDVQDTLYDQYTYFMSCTNILCPIHVFYDVQYTYFMCSTHFMMFRTLYDQYTYFTMSRTLWPVYLFMSISHVLFPVYMFYVQYTYWCPVHIVYVQYTYFVSSTHFMCSTHSVCPVHTFYDVQYTFYVHYTYFMPIAHVCPVHTFCVQYAYFRNCIATKWPKRTELFHCTYASELPVSSVADFTVLYEFVVDRPMCACVCVCVCVLLHTNVLAWVRRILNNISLIRGHQFLVSDCDGRYLNYAMLPLSGLFIPALRISEVYQKQTSYAKVGSFKLLKTKRNVLYIRKQSVPRCKHFPPWL